MNPDDGFGDQPDTIAGRLVGISRLVDTLDDEVTPERRALRLEVIGHLLAEVVRRVEELS